MGMPKEKVYTLLGIILALFLGALDQTIVATALPKIVEDLNGLNRYSMIATAYLVASTAFVPIYGKLADTYNRKSIELWAIGLFLAGSFLCGVSGEFGHLPIIGDGMNQLVLFRTIQGLGGAGLFAMAFIIIADLFPPAERGKYQGLTGAAFAIASILGPYLGGLLTDYGGSIIKGVEGWRWVFYVNIPFAILALFFIIRKMPNLIPKSTSKKFDIVAALYLILCLGPLVLAIELDKSGYMESASISWIFLGIAILSFILFYQRSRRSQNPIINIKLFRNKIFRNSNLALLFLGAAFLGIILFLPLYLINVKEFSATKAGITLIPLSFGVVIGSILAGHLVSYYGHYKWWMVGGAIIFITSVVFMSQMNLDTKYFHIILFVFICGIGAGPSMPLYTLAIQNSVHVRHIGQATSSSQFSRHMGGTLGSALLGSILAFSLISGIKSNTPPKLQESGFNMPGIKEQNLRAFDKENIHHQLDSQFQLKYRQLYQAVEQKNLTRWQELKKDPLIADIIQGYNMETLSDQKLMIIKASFENESQQLNQSIGLGIKKSFNVAISKIFYVTIAFLIVGTVITLFIPEVPLRKTNEGNSFD